jgi:hypothetical protein
MLNQADAMRVMAEKYLKLARISDDATERRKFLGYAGLYAQLAERSVRQKALREWIVSRRIPAAVSREPDPETGR